MIKKTIQKLLFFYLVIITNASALIEIDITEGNREPLPIAVTNFFYAEDAIRAQFMQCWSIPIGIPFDDTMIVKIKISLNTDGSLLEPPEVLQHERMNKPSEKDFRTLAESALRAVRRCDPIKAPDINRYESWKKIQLNFDPREILRG